MTKWTTNQLQAINETGKNIIVSAGAGSGKTAVLTERVITKLKQGTNIQNLLILTFTNAAATEMKDRIRSAIKKDPNLKSQLDYIDSAYITTFDSFSMSIIKKYHYILNVSPNISVVEKTICDNVRSEIIDEIFLNKYEQKDKYFLKMINDLCIKDDTEIKKSIININEKLNRLINKKEYLNNYIDNYYNDKNINNLISKFNLSIINRIKKVELLLNDLYNYCDEKYYNNVKDVLNELINSKTYSEIKSNIVIKLPILPRNSSDELKNIKTNISDEIKNIKKCLIYKDEKHIIDTLLSTKDYACSIIDIISILDEKINEYKSIKDEYEFNDIALMAIKLVKENEDIRKEISDSFEEIMVDEYQDTSDIQEELISSIGHDNIYMVGDIKQSIYRFRNANPDIFKEKYEKYSNNDGGIKIDLLNNFRSRKEVLDDINTIFNLVMDSSYGGANYKESHQMNFGNNAYIENNPIQNKNLEILNYNRDNKRYSSSEYEAFIIANDIKNKIKNKYQVLDKKTNTLRNARYDDFCILIDRKSSFELYKKIFEYLGIPLVIYYDEKITTEKDVLIIKNIIDMIIRIYNNNLDTKFEYDFYSVMRSYIGNMLDQDYVNYYINKDYKSSEIYNKCLSICDHLDILSNSELIDEIIDKFNFYEKTICVGEMEKFIVRTDYLKSLGDNLSSLGYSIIEFNDYLQDMVLSDSDITFSLNMISSNSVKLMNIHKSKGLEFPICYFAGYSNKFNRLDLNDKMNFDKELGLILPFYDNGIGNTIVKEIFRYKYNEEDISERIRLFYVALTRAKEKMIIVSNLSSNEYNLTEELKSEYNSFLSILESIKDNLNDRIIYVEDIELTKSYNMNKNKTMDLEDTNELINVHEIHIDNNLIEESQVSKHINKLITEKEESAMEYGTKMHKILEVCDLKTSNIEIISKFRNHINNINEANIYKEYEFTSVIDNKKYNGIIDLILEFNDCVYIIDYKLKNISDENYIKQLNVYKNYIYNKLNKEVKTYLYSIIDDELVEINNI